jgi:hypothetical protein
VRIVTSGLRPHHRFDYPRMIRDLLVHVPPEHLGGISGITVSGDRPLDDGDDVLGQYYEKYESDPAVIVLYLETMRREVPRPLLPFPITWRILLAQTLFHEIGHHYQRFSHGIAKQRQEEHAEAYGMRLTRKAFPGWMRLVDRAVAVRARWNRLMIRLLGVGVRLRPTAALHEELGRRAWNEGDWDRVILHWEEALRMGPDAPRLVRLVREARWQRERDDRRRRSAAAYATARPRQRQARRRGGRRKKNRRR